MSNLNQDNARAVTEFGKRLEAEMQKKQLTKAELADRSKVTYDTILKIFNKDHVPGLRVAGRLATAVDRPLHELLKVS